MPRARKAAVAEDGDTAVAEKPTRSRTRGKKAEAPKAAEASTPSTDEEATSERGPRAPAIPGDTGITWLVEENPKRPGSAAHERWEGYYGSETVEEYLENGGTRGDLRWDIDREFIELA